MSSLRLVVKPVGVLHWREITRWSRIKSRVDSRIGSRARARNVPWEVENRLHKQFIRAYYGHRDIQVVPQPPCPLLVKRTCHMVSLSLQNGSQWDWISFSQARQLGFESLENNTGMYAIWGSQEYPLVSRRSWGHQTYQNSVSESHTGSKCIRVTCI